MSATDSFFSWFYTGLNGLGGWFVLLFLALAAVIWIFYDSSTRHLPVTGWRLGVLLTAALLLPAVIFRFSSAEIRDSLSPFLEAMFYLGLLGGLIPVVMGAGYYVTFQGMVACPHGHVYEEELGECPECASLAPAPSQPAYAAPPVQRPPTVGAQQPAAAPPPQPKPKAHAWLIAEDGHSYQLNLGTTSIGKSGRNDIQFIGDTTISREHAKVVEQNGRFRLHDLGSTNGTKVNGRLVRQPILLEPDDRIELGDDTQVTFVTSRR